MFFELLPYVKRYRTLGYSVMSSRTSSSLYPTGVRVVLLGTKPLFTCIEIVELHVTISTVSAARMHIKFHCMSCLYVCMYMVIKFSVSISECSTCRTRLRLRRGFSSTRTSYPRMERHPSGVRRFLRTERSSPSVSASQGRTGSLSRSVLGQSIDLTEVCS